VVAYDERTQRYFDEHTPEYTPGRYSALVEFLRADATDGSSLLDIGCGSGSGLKVLVDNTPVSDVAGLDVSPAYLDKCAALLPGCQTCLASILDEDLQIKVGRRFRYVLAGAILHHLVGRDRKESLAHAREGLRAAWSLVEEGGGLVVMEPTYSPRWLMSSLFHVKRLVSRVASGRVTLFGHWNNIGEPIVSYFSHDELVREVAALPGAGKALEVEGARRIPWPWRLAGVTRRAESVVIARKQA
jgi:SAM-dependent methyltransferase